MPRRDEFIAYRLSIGRTARQAEREYRQALRVTRDPGKWAARNLSYLNGKSYRDRRIADGATPDQAKRELASLRKDGVKPSIWHASRTPPVKERKLAETPLSRINLAEYEGLMGQAPRAPSLDQPIPGYRVEEWMSSGGGSTASGKSKISRVNIQIHMRILVPRGYDLLPEVLEHYIDQFIFEQPQPWFVEFGVINWAIEERGARPRRGSIRNEEQLRKARQSEILTRFRFGITPKRR